MIVVDVDNPVLKLYPRHYRGVYKVILDDLMVSTGKIILEDCEASDLGRGVVGIKLDTSLVKDKVYYLEVYSEDGISFRGKCSTGIVGDLTVDDNLIKI